MSYLNPKLFNNGTRPYINTGSINYTIPYSHPATVDIYFFWEGLMYIPNSTLHYEIYYYDECNGVLINRRTILTSASCIITSIPFSPSGYKNDTIDLKKEYSPLYSEWNSHYEIYYKINQDITSNFRKNIWPTEQLVLQDIIVVCLKINIF